MNQVLYYSILQHMTLIFNYLQSHLQIKHIKCWQNLILQSPIIMQTVKGITIPVVVVEVLKSNINQLSFFDKVNGWSLINHELARRGIPMYCLQFFSNANHITLHLVYAGDDNRVHWLAQRHLQKNLYDVLESIPIDLMGE